VLAVNPASLSAHKQDYAKLIKIWDRIVHYINDPKTQDDAVKIMAARSGLEPAAYKPILAGTHLLDVAAGKEVFKKAEGLDSLYGSTKVADEFNVKNGVYKQPQDVDSYIDPSLAAGK
jgi:NitT/TauT family transport system substrate-binding protein